MRKRASILAKMSQYTAGKETLDMNYKNLGYELLLNTRRGMVGGDAWGACRWPLLFPIVSCGVPVVLGASLLLFGSGRLSRLPHQWDQSLRVM